jgi:hypothetical protein
LNNNDDDDDNNNNNNTLCKMDPPPSGLQFQVQSFTHKKSGSGFDSEDFPQFKFSSY